PSAIRMQWLVAWIFRQSACAAFFLIIVKADPESISTVTGTWLIFPSSLVGVKCFFSCMRILCLGVCDVVSGEFSLEEEGDLVWEFSSGVGWAITLPLFSDALVRLKVYPVRWGLDSLFQDYCTRHLLQGSLFFQ